MLTPHRLSGVLARRARRLADIHLADRLDGIRGCRDRHRGETAVMIGNGPSVRPDDLDRLGGALTFSFNRFHLAHPLTTHRPTYTVVADAQMLERFGAEIASHSGGEVFLASPYRPAWVASDFTWVQLRRTDPFEFSTVAHRFISPGGSVVVAALQIAFFMGVRTVHLYGMDHHFSWDPIPGEEKLVHGEGNHFIDDYRAGEAWYRPERLEIDEALAICGDAFGADGRRITNATRGGALDLFERMDFDALFPGRTRAASPQARPGTDAVAGEAARMQPSSGA